jgi:hypothetical protein
MALESTKSLTEMSTRNLPGSKALPVIGADKHTAICEPIVYTMWEPRRLTTLWISTACYRDSFTLFLRWSQTQRLRKSYCYYPLFLVQVTWRRVLLNKKPVAWVHERTIPTERPPLVGEASFADRGCHAVSVTDPYGRILGFLGRAYCWIHFKRTETDSACSVVYNAGRWTKSKILVIPSDILFLQKALDSI